MKADRPVRVALVGCGAMGAVLHLPVLSRIRGCHVVALVDPLQDRAAELAARYGITRIHPDHTRLDPSTVDAVVLAAPNHLHAPIALDLLGAGHHVYVEKPLGLTTSECDTVIDAARRHDRVLAVGLITRYAHAVNLAKAIVRADLLGRVTSVSVEYGFAFAWPIASDFTLRRAAAGGGVLLDLGSHIIDLLVWLLGQPAVLRYADDAHGGVEANCLAELAFPSGATGTVELSRDRDLAGTVVLDGERGRLEFSVLENTLTLRTEDDARLVGTALFPDSPALPDQSPLDLVEAAHRDFFRAISTAAELHVTGEDARAATAIIEDCYRRRTPLDLPWLRVPEQAS